VLPLLEGKKALIVHPLLADNQELSHLVGMVRKSGAEVVGAGVVVNSNPEITDEAVGAHFFALEITSIQYWEDANLPDWLKERPVKQIK
jgi:adenine/guanine phosphoribosyltransferase-like PRPP-binding protein